MLLQRRVNSTCWLRRLESPLDCKEIQPVHPKEINPECSMEAKAPILGHLMRRTDSLEKTLMLGKTEVGGEGDERDEVVGWHHQLNGHGFVQTLEDSEGQGSLVCCTLWGRKESDAT